MAVVLEQVKAATTEVNQSVLAIADGDGNLSPEPPTNDCVIVVGCQFWVSTNGSFVVSTPTGFTQDIDVDNATNLGGHLSHKLWVNGVDGTAIQQTSSTARKQALIALHYSGLKNTADPLDVTAQTEFTDAVTSLTSGTTANVASAGSLAIAVFGILGANGDTIGTPTFTNGFTLIASVNSANQNAEIYVASKIVPAGSPVETTCSHSGAATRMWGGVAVFADEGVVSPINTFPESGVCMTALQALSVGTVSVEDPVGVQEIAFTNTLGGIMGFTLSGSVTIKAGTANFSDTVTLEGGASTAEFNTVLATMTYQGATGTHGEDTITMLTMGGTSGTQLAGDVWSVLNDPGSVLVTGPSADILSTIETLAVRLNTGESIDTIDFLTTDLTSPIALTSDTSFVVQSVTIVVLPVASASSASTVTASLFIDNDLVSFPVVVQQFSVVTASIIRIPLPGEPKKQVKTRSRVFSARTSNLSNI